MKAILSASRLQFVNIAINFSLLLGMALVSSALPLRVCKVQIGAETTRHVCILRKILLTRGCDVCLQYFKQNKAELTKQKGQIFLVTYFAMVLLFGAVNTIYANPLPVHGFDSAVSSRMRSNSYFLQPIRIRQLNPGALVAERENCALKIQFILFFYGCRVSGHVPSAFSATCSARCKILGAKQDRSSNVQAKLAA